MKILYIIPYDWGGMVHYTVELANAVAEYENVSILTSNGINLEYFTRNVKVYCIFKKLHGDINNLKKNVTMSNFLALLSYRRIKVIEQINPDVIHFTTPISFPLPIFFKLFGYDRKYKIVYTNHYIHQDSDIVLELIGKFQCLLDRTILFQRVIVHTTRDQEYLLQKKIFRPQQLVTIPHPIYNLFSKITTSPKNKPDRKEYRYVLFFGFIREYKGLSYLIKSVQNIRKQIPNIKIIIAGEGDLTSYIPLISETGDEFFEIHNNYISDEEVNELFLKAEVVVIPYSQMTGQSGVLNIAFAYGKPVVSTNVWGFNEVISSGVTGLIVPPKDSGALSDAICLLLTNEELAKMISDNVVDTSKKFSTEISGKKHIEIYKEICK